MQVQCGINQLSYGCALSSLSRKMPRHWGYILIVSSPSERHVTTTYCQSLNTYCVFEWQLYFVWKASMSVYVFNYRYTRTHTHTLSLPYTHVTSGGSGCEKWHYKRERNYDFNDVKTLQRSAFRQLIWLKCKQQIWKPRDCFHQHLTTWQTRKTLKLVFSRNSWRLASGSNSHDRHVFLISLIT